MAIKLLKIGSNFLKITDDFLAIDLVETPQFNQLFVANTAPNVLFITFDKAVNMTDGTGFSIQSDGDSISMTFSFFDGSSLATFDLSRDAVFGETLTISVTDQNNVESQQGGFPLLPGDFIVDNQVEGSFNSISDTLETSPALNEIGDTVLPSKVATQRAVGDSVVEGAKSFFIGDDFPNYALKTGFEVLGDRPIAIFGEVRRLASTAGGSGGFLYYYVGSQLLALTAGADSIIFVTIDDGAVRQAAVTHNPAEKVRFAAILDNVAKEMTLYVKSINDFQKIDNIPFDAIKTISDFSIGTRPQSTNQARDTNIYNLSVAYQMPSAQNIEDYLNKDVNVVENAFACYDSFGGSEKYLFDLIGGNNIPITRSTTYQLWDASDNQFGSNNYNDLGYRIAGNGTDFLNNDGTGVIDQGTKIPAINSNEAASFDSLGNHQPLTVTGEVNYYANVSDDSQSLLADNSNSVTFDVCPALVQIDTDSFLFTTITVDNEDLQTPVILVNSDFDTAPSYIQIEKNGNGDITRIQIER